MYLLLTTSYKGRMRRQLKYVLPVIIKKVGAGMYQVKGKEFTFAGEAYDAVKASDGTSYGHTYKRYYAK